MGLMKVQLLLTNGALRVREEFCWNVVGNAHTVPLGFYSPTTGKSRAVFIGYETAFLHVGVFGYPDGPHVHSVVVNMCIYKVMHRSNRVFVALTTHRTYREN